MRWEYDDSSRIKTQAWQMGQQSYSESYTYSTKDGSLTSVSMNGGSLQLGYDALSRLSTAGNGVYTRNYTYRDISGSQTTTQVEKLRYTGLNGALSGLTYNYTYNPLGNIASVTSGGSTSSYTYDTMGQLTAASLPGMQYAYTYDGAGNLRTVTRGETTNTYTYGNASWKDLLTAFNGEKIVYEGQTMDEDGSVTGTPVSGNPIRYYNGTPWNFSWAEGRSLKTAESSTPEQDISLEFSYDADGLRIEKHVTKTVYEMTAEHTYTDTVVAPTCTEGGYTLHECECGDSYTDTEVPALGHDYAASNTPGLLACTRCGDTTSHTEHSYTESVVEPTCTQKGYTLHTCECGDSYKDNEVAALGHDYEETKVVEPTCVAAGYTICTCTRCGMTTRTNSVKALGHLFSKITLPRTCSRCGYVEGGATLPTVPPSQGEIMGLEEPTEPEVPLQNEPDEPTDDTLEEPEMPDTPPTENAPLHRGAATEIEEIHQYIYAGGKLLRETISDATTTKTLDFNYDNVGMPYSLIYNNGTTTTTYYYITNLQGDVMYLADASGNEVAAYDYDPYGKVISSTGDLAEINPLRYRGYYYDTETGFYYLQSRYYDPEICRFINADSYASTEQGFIGYNMFAYCDNNPVIRFDNGGTFWNIVIGAAVGAIVSGVVSFATQAIEHGIENVNWARVGIAAASGAITGGCAASGIPVNGQMIVGGVVGAVSSGLDTYYAYKNSDEKATVWDYTKNIAIGATLGVIGGRLGGSGTGTKHLTQSAKQALSRGKNAISSLGKQGVKYVTKELAKTGKYYYSQIAVEAVRAGRQAIKSILIGAIPSASYSILSVV